MRDARARRPGTHRARVPGRALGRGGLVVAAVSAAVALVVGAGGAAAWWSASATASATATAATVPVPPTPTCSESGLLNVKLSFTDPSTVPTGATRTYSLVVRSGSTVVGTIDPYTSGTAVSPGQVGSTQGAMTATLVTKLTFGSTVWTSAESGGAGLQGASFIFAYLNCS
ncbi:hypothetical protein [Cellulomonas alba]|uniref:Uncharacterized protein n=1 Tax=Cellulomonas alba TaxID=3053467 RepID=A0ABT7SDY0_9CELL|nr:hypothetical protein [Cellulomonas alba]MDM7854395.1 hypothetical protein [Cellulomonas alba]